MDKVVLEEEVVDSPEAPYWVIPWNLLNARKVILWEPPQIEVEITQGSS